MDSTGVAHNHRPVFAAHASGVIDMQRHARMQSVALVCVMGLQNAERGLPFAMSTLVLAP